MNVLAPEWHEQDGSVSKVGDCPFAMLVSMANKKKNQADDPTVPKQRVQLVTLPVQSLAWFSRLGLVAAWETASVHSPPLRTPAASKNSGDVDVHETVERICGRG